MSYVTEKSQRTAQQQATPTKVLPYPVDSLVTSFPQTAREILARVDSSINLNNVERICLLKASIDKLHHAIRRVSKRKITDRELSEGLIYRGVILYCR